MSGIENPSLPTYGLNLTTVGVRDGEYAGTPFTDVPGDGSFADPYLGCNAPGSCAPGIGINTGDFSPQLQDWTLLDQGLPVESGASQTPLVRTPQDTQHLGGDGLGDGDATNHPVKVIQGADINDDAEFVQTAAPVDAGDPLVAGVVNRTGLTVPSGANCWGTGTNA